MSLMKKKTKVAAVIVTYNRIGHLVKTLPLYVEQNCPPDYIIVVNNGSDDGTLEYLNEWEKNEVQDINKIVINSFINTGCSGGVYIGLERALETDAEFYWVADDDAYVHKDAFENLFFFIDHYSEELHSIAAICANVFPRTTEFEPSGLFLEKGLLRDKIIGKKLKDFDEDVVDVDFYPFLGVVFRKEALVAAGNVRKSFFLYQDDFEHSLRVKKQGRIVIFKRIILEHDGNYAFKREASWRDYYETRNALLIEKDYFRKSSFILRIITRMLRAISTLNLQKIKVYYSGVVDAIKGNEGINDIYKPGWTGK